MALTSDVTTLDHLSATDPEIAEAIRHELKRQDEGLELIASENFVSMAVLEAAGSVLTNKYAEGYPGKRYYGGCEFVDVAESLAIERAKQLFGAEHVNVQAHSGAQANMSVYVAMLKPGDTILGMNLAHGGHLTHGHPLNFSGKYFNIVPYGVRESDERLDYDELDRLAKTHRPKLIVVGASAYPRQIDFARVRRTADETGSLVMTDMAHIAGLVAAGEHPSPVPYSDFVTTTTHKTLRGPRGGMVLCKSQFAKDLDRALFPGVQGGPLMHIIAAKAVCFKRSAHARVPRLPASDRPECGPARRPVVRGRLPPREWRHRQPSDPRRRLLTRPDRQGRGARSRARGHHGQQERHSLRQEPADGGERHPRRHAGGHDPRHARG